MDVNNTIINGAVYIPRQPQESQNTEQSNRDKRPIVIDHNVSEVTSLRGRVDSGNADAVEKASDYARTAQQFGNIADRAEKQVAAYKSLEMQNKKAAISQMMGVDVYA